MPSTAGSAVSPQQQTGLQQQTQTAAVASAAAGKTVLADGYANLWVEVVEANVGTATLTCEGSTDNVNWFPIWASVTAANGRTYAATFSVTQNSRTLLKLQDTAPFVRTRLSSNAGSVTCNVYGNPI